MPARPDVSYNPVPQVEPQVDAGNDYLSVRATPQDFGADVGAAQQGLGKQLDETGNSLAAVALQRQGMVNDAISTNAETQYKAQLGTLQGQYKSLQGLDAYGQAPKMLQTVTALRQKMSADLPNPAAQKAFDMLALRQEGYAIQDINSYAATQLKQADTKSAADSMSIAIQGTAGIDTALNDKRFNGALQDADFQTVRILQNQGYSGGMSQDPKTGAVTFSDDPAGQEAKAAYTSMQDKAHGDAWTNRIETLANDPTQGNVNQALAVFNANKDRIPAETQAKLGAWLQPKVRSAQAQSTADSIIAGVDQFYKAGVTASVNGTLPSAPSGSGSNPNNLGNVKTASGAATNTPQFANPTTPVDGATLAANTLRSGYQGLTLSQIGAKWAPSSENKTSDWVGNVSKASGIDANAVPNLNDPATLKSLLTGIATAEKSQTDRALFTDDVINKGVQASLGGQQPSLAANSNIQLASATTQTPAQNADPQAQFQSRANYYRANYAGILQQARDVATNDHPDDPVYQQQAVSRVETQISNVIRQQDYTDRLDNNLVYQAFSGSLTKGNKPTSVAEMTNISPAVQGAWDRMQANNPQAASAVENRILTTNAKSNGHDLNTYGAGYFNALRSINAPAGDPNRIIDPTTLWNRVGENGDLTTAGVEKLTQLIGSKNTPQGEAEAKLQQNAFTMIKGHLSGEDLGLGAGQKDPKGEEIFQHALPMVYDAIDAARAKGIPPGQMYDPESKDFVGKAVMGFQRTPAQYVADLVNANSGKFEDYTTPSPTEIQALDVPTLKSSYGAAKTPELRKFYADEAIRRGLATANPTAPAPQVPILGGATQ